jgi:hypothetical protein
MPQFTMAAAALALACLTVEMYLHTATGNTQEALSVTLNEGAVQQGCRVQQHSQYTRQVFVTMHIRAYC